MPNVCLRLEMCALLLTTGSIVIVNVIDRSGDQPHRPATVSTHTISTQMILTHDDADRRTTISTRDVFDPRRLRPTATSTQRLRPKCFRPTTVSTHDPFDPNPFRPTHPLRPRPFSIHALFYHAIFDPCPFRPVGRTLVPRRARVLTTNVRNEGKELFVAPARARAAIGY